MDTSRLRIGLIGCGDIGRLRARAIAAAPSCELVAVSDIDPERAKTVATQHQALFDRDWATLLQRSDVDTVVVSTPPAVHAQMCREAMEAGKDVLCEKPLARTPEECRTILDAAERSGRRLGVGFNYRFYPSFAAARDVLASGAIGELDHVRAYAGYSATGHNQPWVHDASVVGGGALWDNGIHLIDLTRHFLGDVVEVKGFATGHSWRFPGCEDNGFALLRSADGRIATLHASWTEWRRYQFRIELYGTRGCIRATCFPMTLEVQAADATGGRTRGRRSFFPRWAIGEKLGSYRWVVVQSLVAEFEAFAAARTGASGLVATGLDGLRAVEIADAAARGGALWESTAAPAEPVAQPRAAE